MSQIRTDPGDISSPYITPSFDGFGYISGRPAAIVNPSPASRIPRLMPLPTLPMSQLSLGISTSQLNLPFPQPTPPSQRITNVTLLTQEQLQRMEISRKVICLLNMISDLINNQRGIPQSRTCHLHFILSLVNLWHFDRNSSLY